MINPYIQGNPYETEQQDAKIMADKTEKFQRLCYEVFIVSPEGRELYSMMKDQFLLAPGFSINAPNVSNLAIYWEGIREVVRGLGVAALTHEKRIVNV